MIFIDKNDVQAILLYELSIIDLDVVKSYCYWTSHNELEKVFTLATFAGLYMNSVRANVNILRLETAHKLMIKEYFEFSTWLVSLPLKANLIVSFLQSQGSFNKRDWPWIQSGVLGINSVLINASRSNLNRCIKSLNRMTKGLYLIYNRVLESEFVKKLWPLLNCWRWKIIGGYLTLGSARSR